MHLLNIGIKVGIGKVSLYGYDMDMEDLAAASNRTMGIRFAGTLDGGDLKFPVELEFATQEDTADNTTSYSADYSLASIGVNFGSSGIGVALETLESDDSAGKAFQTPLATGHKFLGWADKFLGTPSAGIEDTSISLKHGQGAHKFAVVYHDFEAETGSGEYGTELDASWAYKINSNYGLVLKYARYEADTAATVDTDKFWLMLTAKF